MSWDASLCKRVYPVEASRRADCLSCEAERKEREEPTSDDHRRLGRLGMQRELEMHLTHVGNLLYITSPRRESPKVPSSVHRTTLPTYRDVRQCFAAWSRDRKSS